MLNLRVLGGLLAAATLVASVEDRDPSGLRAPERQAQTSASAAGTGLLMGVVVDALNGNPVAGSLVILGGSAPRNTNPIQYSQGKAVDRNREILTDAEGHFLFTDLSQGHYTITASRLGYSEGAYGRRWPAGPAQPVSLDAGERVGDLRILIWKDAAITGVVTDEAGEALIGIPVRVLLRTLVAGRRMLLSAGQARTDDRGLYRVASLTPGDYIVVVPSTQTSAPESVVDLLQREQSSGLTTPSDLVRNLSASRAGVAINRVGASYPFRVDGLLFDPSTDMPAIVPPAPTADGRIFVYPTQYSPAITLRSGEERSGVDLQMRLSDTSRVSGTVTGPAGPVAIGLSLVLQSSDLPMNTNLDTATTWSEPAGRFTFLGVPSGDYLLRAVSVPQRGRSSPPNSSQSLWASLPISVGASDIRGIVLTLRTGFHIRGRLAFEGLRTKQPSTDVMRRLQANLEPADGRPLDLPSMSWITFDLNGAFSSAELPQGKYFVRFNGPPPGWTFRSAVVDGHDVANVPLSLDRDVDNVVLTLTDHPGELNGWVQGPTATQAADAIVLVFPVESGSWTDYGKNPPRLRLSPVSVDGSFRVVGLPAGDYLVVAVPNDARVDWQDPRTLETLAGKATTVTLRDAETRAVSLKTVVLQR